MIKQVLNLVVASLIISVQGQDDLETLRWRGSGEGCVWRGGEEQTIAAVSV